MQVARLLYQLGQAARTGVLVFVLPDENAERPRVELFRGWVHAVFAEPARALFTSQNVPPRGQDALAALLRLDVSARFFDELPLEKRGACTPFHPAALVRNAIDRVLVDEIAARVGAGTVQLPSPPHASCLGVDERPLIAFLQRPRTLDEITASKLCPPTRASRLLAFLDAVGALIVTTTASPYRLLGLPEGAPLEAVKRAYHRLAYELHPDRHPSASDEDRRTLEQRFAEVSAAYRQLV